MQCRWLLIICALFLAACASPASPAATSPVGTPTAAPGGTGVSGPVIIYSRNGGFAGRQEVWRIYADGRVVYELNGKPGGQTPTTVAGVDAALQQISGAGFFSLEDTYMPADKCCDRFTYSLAVTYNGTSKTVTTMDGVQQPLALSTALSVTESLIPK